VGERQQRKGGAWIMELGLLVVIVRTLDTRGVKFSDGCKFGMNSPSFEGEEGGHTLFN
jgi:hypothetical protein